VVNIKLTRVEAERLVRAIVENHGRIPDGIELTTYRRTESPGSRVGTVLRVDAQGASGQHGLRLATIPLEKDR
jgi:hypothetical protein